MRHGLLTLSVNASPYDAMDMIARCRVTGLPIVDEAMHLLGVVTEKDVLTYCMDPFPVETTIAALMIAGVVAFDRKTDLDLIYECLIQKDFHRVPILDEGRLVGIISCSDILRSRIAAFR